MVKKMVRTAWQELLPRLRELLDRKGLQHIAINNDSGELYITTEQLSERFVARHENDISFSFQPNDADWRIYQVEGAPFEKWVNKAKASDIYGTPIIVKIFGREKNI